MAKFTITQKSGSATYTLSTGARGPKGDAGASTAADVSFSPTGNIAATDVQAALAELDSEKASAGHTHAQLHDRQHSVTSTSDHTFPGGTTTFLRADGTFATPPETTVDNAAVNTAIAENTTATLGAANIGYLPTKYSIDISGVNYTAVADGPSGGNVSVAHVASGTGSSVLSVGVVGNAITVTAGSATTNQSVATAVNANGSAAALVTATAIDMDNRVAGSQTTTFAARSATNLTAPNAIVGGVNKLARYNANGDLETAPFQNEGIAYSSGGNVILADMRGIIWRQKNGEFGSNRAGIFMWEDHDTYGGELLITTPNRICFSQGENGAIQIGLQRAPGNPCFTYLQTRAAATSTAQGDSQPLYFAGRHWDGLASVNPTSFVSIQGITRSSDGQMELVLSAGGDSFPGNTAGSDANRPQTVIVAPEGLRDPNGNSPSFVALTDGATITAALSTTKSSQNHYVTLAGNRTLAFSGLTSGMRGTIVVSQDATGGRTLTLPSTSAKQTTLSLSTDPLKVDVLHWFYTGTDIFWEIANDFILPVDAHAAAFLSAATISESSTEGIAINNLVKQLKSDDLWDDIVEAWPLVGGTSGKHAYGLKRAYDANFGSGVTHDANGITGDATTNAWMNSKVEIATLGIRDDSGVYLYNRTSDWTSTGNICGAAGPESSSRNYISRGANSVVANGPSSNTTGSANMATLVSDFRGHYWLGRISSTQILGHFNSQTSGVVTNNAVNAASDPMYFLGRNSSTGTKPNQPAGTGTGTNANIAFAAVTKAAIGSDSTKWTAWKAAIDAFQTALSRNI